MDGVARKITGIKKYKIRKRKQPQKVKTTVSGTSIEAEVTLWTVLAISIVLLISNFGIEGTVGNAISSFFFGLVGLVCYPLPIFMFLGIAFVISNGGNPRAYRKMAAFFCSFWQPVCLCRFLQKELCLRKKFSPIMKYQQSIKPEEVW